MNINSIRTFAEKTWDESVIPAMMEYVAIPAVSPNFSKDWETNGYLLDTLNCAKSFYGNLELKNSALQVINEPGRTPILLIEIESTLKDKDETVFLYGHLDKQPPGKGWDENKGAFTPVIENGKLYGRGSADDGYAVFTALTAIKALQSNNIAHGKCVILIETCEESGSADLEYYIEKYKDIIGTPHLIVCLDSGCGDYDRLWVTTSLRGGITCELEAQILTQGIHSGTSGIVASSFRILRQILDRIEDSKTGEIRIPELHGSIPEIRLEQIKEMARELGGSIAASIPLVNGATTISDDPEKLLINSTWKPTLSYIGADGLPPIESAGNVLRESTKLLLSFRIPPTVDSETAAAKLKSIVEQDPPYGAKINFKLLEDTKGWDMPNLGQHLESKINTASTALFGIMPCYTGEGGSIPFMTLLENKFPDAKFLVTGVLGPQSNAHGPNEFLHIPYVKKLTTAISYIIGDF